MPVGNWKSYVPCCATVIGRRALPEPTSDCGCDCENWPKIVAAGDIGGYMFC